MLDDAELEEQKSLWMAVAAGLADLSCTEVTPSEVDARQQFDVDDVRSDSESLVEHLVRMQDWLRLPVRLDPLATVTDTVNLLFPAMGIETALALGTTDGDLVLTEAGLTRIRDRVDEAVRLRDKFVETLEELGSVDGATSAWIGEWDETVEEATSGPVVAKATTWPIFEFAHRARRDRLNLNPSYQRGDVWPVKDRQMLIESILRGIPLPSVIILKTKSQDVVFEVVDGKQRLTSILMFMGAHPTALQLVEEMDKKFPDHKLKQLFVDDYVQFKKSWKTATGETLSASLENKYYFPFKLSTAFTKQVGALKELSGQYYDVIKNKTVRVGGETVEIRDIFEASTDYKIPVIEYTEATRRQIHDVFNLYNKQGKHLNAEEIRNALFHEIELMRVLSVAAGDDKHPAEEFLKDVLVKDGSISRTLDDYKFGDARYRKTKVLSWLYSLLFSRSLGDDGRYRPLSTAQQTNNLLERIQDNANDPLRKRTTILSSLTVVRTALEAHSAADAWAPKFMDNGAGRKWQELQLVASLLGASMAAVVLKGDTAARLSDTEQQLYAKSATRSWLRPPKTQTATQWEYIANVSLGLLDELRVDPAAVDEALERDFGFSCVSALQDARTV